MAGCAGRGEIEGVAGLFAVASEGDESECAGALGGEGAGCEACALLCQDEDVGCFAAMPFEGWCCSDGLFDYVGFQGPHARCR